MSTSAEFIANLWQRSLKEKKKKKPPYNLVWHQTLLVFSNQNISLFEIMLDYGCYLLIYIKSTNTRELPSVGEKNTKLKGK